MVTVSQSFAKKLFFDSDQNPIANILIDISDSQTTDISSFINKFGSISRSMEYDTGKFSPGRHSFDLNNATNYGDYLFTTRHKNNNKATPGTNYWTDLNYRLYFGYKDALNMNTTQEQDELICVYEGKINNKLENRINDSIKISSNDIVKILNDTKLCQQVKTSEIFVETVADTASDDKIDKALVYGKHELPTTPQTTRVFQGCSAYLSGGLYYIEFNDYHNITQWSDITISGSTSYDGDYVVTSVPNYHQVTVWASFGASQTCTVTVKEWSKKLKEEEPFLCPNLIPNEYIANADLETVGARYTITDVIQRSGYPNTMYVYTAENHDAVGNTNYFIEGSHANYNKHEANYPCIGTINSYAAFGYNTLITFSGVDFSENGLYTASDAGGGKVLIDYTGTLSDLTNGSYVMLASAVPALARYSGSWQISEVNIVSHTFKITTAYIGSESGKWYRGQFNINIYGNGSGYNGNYTLTLGSPTSGYFNHVYIDDAAPRGYFRGRNVITLTATPTSSYTGYLYIGTNSKYQLWYYGADNFEFSDVTGVYFWDYIAKKWCVLNDGYTILEATNGGIYVKIDNYGNITDSNAEKKWYSDSFWQYTTGTGTYFNSGAKPQLALKCEHIVHVAVDTYYFANPIAIAYDIIVNQCGIASTVLDKGNWASLSDTYTWDKAARYFCNDSYVESDTRFWSEGGNIAIMQESSISALDFLQNLLSLAGIMLINTFIDSTSDRRLKLIINESYDHDTDCPNGNAIYATNDCVTNLEISTDNDKLKDKIVMSNLNTSSWYYFDLITKGTGNKVFEVMQDDNPTMWWYNSNFWADRCATNYYNKLYNVREDVKLTIDARGVIVDLGDYIMVYDHKANEEIVLQVYSWSFNIDAPSTALIGKKVWSSLD